MIKNVLPSDQHTGICVLFWSILNIKSFDQCEKGNQEPVSIMSCCHVMSIGKLSQVPPYLGLGIMFCLVGGGQRKCSHCVMTRLCESSECRSGRQVADTPTHF